MVLARTGLAIGLLAGVAACATILGIEDARPTDTATRNDAGEDVAAPTPIARCDDTSSDPKNCGVCGHDCLGGECKAGACTPTVVLEARALEPAGVEFYGTIAIDDGTVVWRDVDRSNAIALRHCAAAGCVPTRAAQQFTELPLLARGRLYYQSDKQLLMQPLDGGPPKLLFTGPESWELSGVDRATATVFFDVDVDSARELRACTADGCAIPRVVYRRNREGGSISYAAVSDGELYMAEGSDGSLVRCPSTGCMPDAATAVGTVFRPNVAKSAVVAVKGSYNIIHSCTLPACADDHVVYTEPFDVAVEGLETDGVDVYWSSTDNTIARCPLAGCTEKTVLMKGPQDPNCSDDCFRAGVALDEKSVVWTQRDKIYRLALPPR